jgi:hypothetical protein
LLLELWKILITVFECQEYEGQGCDEEIDLIDEIEEECDDECQDSNFINK